MQPALLAQTVRFLQIICSSNHPLKPFGQSWTLASYYFFFTFIIRRHQHRDTHHDHGHDDQEVVIRIINQTGESGRKKRGVHSDRRRASMQFLCQVNHHYDDDGDDDGEEGGDGCDSEGDDGDYDDDENDAITQEQN